jgi:hypothetical protein
MPVQTRTEYRVRVIGKKGEKFVPNAYNADVSVAVNIYGREKSSLLNRTEGNKVTIEKHIIETEITDYTEVADKLIADAGDSL